LIFDEIQAGFGRTGTLFGFEHYGVIPDIFTLGKGVSSGLPLSAVVGRPDILDLYEPGTMTSTHSGNPLCAAASLANINVILKEKLAENAAGMGKILERELAKFKEKFPQVGFVCGKGLVWGLGIVVPGTMEPDPDAAFEIVRKSVMKGLLFFAPVGVKSSLIKISPPLVIKEEAVLEGCAVLEEVFKEITAK
jgi:4-aminobutyrate aminotransferase-like enzyme